MCGHASSSIGTHSVLEMVLGRWLRVQQGTISLLKAQYTALRTVIVQELCESGGGRPGLPFPNDPYGLCGRKATLNGTGLV